MGRGFLFCPSIAGRSLRELGFRATGRGRPVGLRSCCAALVIFWPLNRRALTFGQLGFRATGRGRPVGLRSCCAALVIFLAPQSPGADLWSAWLSRHGARSPGRAPRCCAALVIFWPLSRRALTSVSLAFAPRGAVARSGSSLLRSSGYFLVPQSPGADLRSAWLSRHEARSPGRAPRCCAALVDREWWGLLPNVPYKCWSAVQADQRSACWPRPRPARRRASLRGA